MTHQDYESKAPTAKAEGNNIGGGTWRRGARGDGLQRAGSISTYSRAHNTTPRKSYVCRVLQTIKFNPIQIERWKDGEAEGYR